jgi:acyl carrier protein
VSDVEARIVAVVSRAAMVPAAALEPGRTLVDLGVRSLEQIECVLALEDEFEVEVSEAHLRRAKTVQDLIDLVKTALADKDSRTAS